MSNVKGNDIDDLFKRAADQYPLRTDSADWNKLAADLDKDRSLIIPPANVGGGDKRKRRRFFWLFLLLPLGGIGYYAVQSSRQAPATAQQNTVKAEAAPTLPSGKGSDPEKDASAGTPATESTGKTPPTAGTNTPVTESTRATPSTAGTPSGARASVGTTPGKPVTATTPSGTVPSAGSASRKSTPATTPSGTIPLGTAVRVTPAGTALTHSADRNSRNTEKKHTIGNAPKTDKDETGSGSTKGLAGSTKGQTINRTLTKRPSTEGEITGRRRTKGTSTGQPGTAEEGIVSRTEGDLSLSALKSPRARTSGDINLTVTVAARNNPVTAKDSSGTKKNIQAKNKKESFFYAGLIVAPDLSTVKMQSVKGVGTTFGVLLGYQFNHRWAIETGAYLDHKKYYTDGEYFKQKNPNPSYTLLNVNGYCNMWEIPINVRYNLSSGPTTKWFATAGLSTYLMTRENYISKIQTSTWTYDSPWDIKKPSQYWFSVVNLSAGFEQKIGRIGNLRLEPYLRIPLKGMGTGSLPIMSAGLNIGITRRIW